MTITDKGPEGFGDIKRLRKATFIKPIPNSPSKRQSSFKETVSDDRQRSEQSLPWSHKKVNF